MTKSDLLRHWRFRVHRVQIGHYEAGRACERRHLWLGIPAVVLTTLVGTAVFSSLQEFSDQQALIYPKIIVGFFSVTAAVLVGLQTFLRYSEQASSHKNAGAKYSHLKHRIELLAVLPPATDEALKRELADIELEWDRVREESPNLPTSIWRRMEAEITFEDDLESQPGFGALL
ncbi:SLATT domain-containing protein [Pseudomaricurvus sp. HS19]|uniref:SLATT domain-containing protein n=1 Tax=Pseudomaricurvus sp. HS19 TaxID=2692626 RepID=UPI00136CAFBD|nr:SLATT domain-containing protein [Pseudomaricurvus sp. HS19]MYM63331.1 SLATT domain-containing protein [Pseudomaricurvus sp. HS19]